MAANNTAQGRRLAVRYRIWFGAASGAGLSQDDPQGTTVPIVVAKPRISDFSQQSNEAVPRLLGDEHLLDLQP